MPVPTVPTVTLNNGVTMPVLGFGVYQVPDAAECQRVVEHALEAGYRLIDTAAAYGNEEAVGRAIAASGLPRDEVFVTTKLWVQDQGEQAAARAFDASARRLGLDVIDLYLIHQPFGDCYGSWRAMQRLNEQGRARAIGVSNFMPDRLVDLVLHSDVVPAIDQVETHVFHQRVEDQRLMREHGVQIEAWGPLAEGKNGLFTNPVLTQIGAAHDKSVAQVALRWLVQRGVVVIPKSVTPSRIVENIDVFDFALSDDEMRRIGELDGAARIIDHHDPAVVSRVSGFRFHD